MVLSANDKQVIRDRIKKQVEALKAKAKPSTPPAEENVEEGEEA